MNVKNKITLFANKLSLKEIAQEEVKKAYKTYLKDHESGKIIRGLLCPIDIVSQHKGNEKIIISKQAAKQALETLAYQPVHYSLNPNEEFPSKHTTDENEFKSIGVILGGDIVNVDGTDHVQVDALLWDKKHPKIVDTISANKEELGMSFEIIFDRINDSKKLDESITMINKMDFTGLAILAKEEAAYQETEIIHANNDNEEEVEMEKFTQEQVDVLVNAAITQNNSNWETKLAETKGELETKVTDLVAQVETDKTETETKLAVVVAAKTELEEKLSTIETEIKVAKRLEPISEFFASKDEAIQTKIKSFITDASDDDYALYVDGKENKKTDLNADNRMINLDGDAPTDDKNISDDAADKYVTEELGIV